MTDADGHDHDGDGHREPPHEPAPPGPRHLLPPRDMLTMGLGLAGLALGLFVGAWKIARHGGWLFAPLVPVLGGLGALAAWASAIHLTGGEKFDDHPWV